MTGRRLIGDPILRETLPIVVRFDDELRSVAAEVVQHSKDWNPSVGLAANQIGYTHRLFVIKLASVVDVYVNPSLIRQSTILEGEVEGCGSIPDRFFFVRRPATIVARWQTLDGKVKAMQMQNPRARIFQHELDHLNGILISDIGEEYLDEPAPAE